MATTKTRQPTQKATAKKKPKKHTKTTPPATAPKPATGKHPGGRPSVYRAEFCNQAFQHCLLGATDKALAKLFDIAESTLNKWKLDYPEFSECIKRGKADADARVAAALYSRAIGFSKEVGETVVSGNGKLVRTTTKYFPPDPPSIFFWLKNRQPDSWRDKQTQVLENPDGTGIFSGFGFVPFTQKQGNGNEGRGVEEHE